LTLERVRYGARLAKQTGLPVLVTGGSVLGNTVPEALLMKEVLENEYGVPVRWVEDRSRNTRENAELTARLLAADGVRRVVLVLHAFDVPRAVPLYKTADLDVVRAPIGIANGNTDLLDDFVPGIAALVSSYYACYELAGIALGRLP
jgi:uncharacterized SAM-binding protein YcdF (DUF218 family)